MASSDHTERIHQLHAFARSAQLIAKVLNKLRYGAHAPAESASAAHGTPAPKSTVAVFVPSNAFFLSSDVDSTPSKIEAADTA